MKKFEFLDHTSEAKFRAYGKTMEESFGNAALALYNIFVDTDQFETGIIKKVTADGKDLDALLFNFLEQFIILIDSENFLLHETTSVRIVKGGKWHIDCEAIGDTYSEKYETHGGLKAITYNQMLAQQEGEQFVVQVVVDI